MFGRKEFSDEETIREIRRGNKEALVYLYESNHSAVRSYIAKNNGNAEDVDDVLQEAVIVVWQKVNQADFELTSKLSTFLYAVAKNLWLKQLNKAKRTEPIEPHHDEYGATAEQGNLNSMDRRIVLRCMDQLGETCQKLLHLFYFDDMDMKEIAAQLHFANADTAKAKKYQCFKKLEQLVKASFHKSDFMH